MNWIISDTEATTHYAGHTFIATKNRAVVMRAGIVVDEQDGFESITHAIVWCQKWAGVK